MRTGFTEVLTEAEGEQLLTTGEAAKLLGIGRATLYRRIATLDLSRDVA